MAGAEARRATMMDVAQLAGVSHQTVSRYLRFNGTGMKDATSEKIRLAIDELDYRPNLAARAMRTRQTGRVAVLLPEGTALYSVDVLEGVRDVSRDAGLDVEVLTVGGDEAARTQRVLELVQSGLFEGILSLTPLRIAIKPGRQDPPVRVSAIYDDQMHGIGDVADGSPIQDLIERLAHDGHERFFHLAGDLAYESARRRRDAYLDAIGRLGVTSAGVIDCRWDPQTAMDAVLDLPADGAVTAIIAANDVLAIAAVRGAHQRGWRVPDDISVTGFDSQAFGAWSIPSLTSVSIDHRALGRRAMAHLLSDLRDIAPHLDDAPLMQISWRESTGSAPHRG